MSSVDFHLLLTSLWLFAHIHLIFGFSYVDAVDPMYFKHERFPTERMAQLPPLHCNNETNFASFGETTVEKPIQYYLLNITTSLKQYDSLSINTCCDYPEASCHPDTSLDTFLYLFSIKRDKLLLRETADDIDSDHSLTTCSNLQKSILDLTPYSQGVYIVGVGGFDEDIGSFQIELNCTGSDPASYYIGYLYFSVFGACLLAFVLFYSHQYRRYYQSHPTGQKATQSTSTMQPSEDSCIDYDHVRVDMHSDHDQLHEMYIAKLQDEIEDEQNTLTAAHTERRVLGGDETREMLMANKEDVILALLGHVEASCNDEHGLDIYQVLAIRAMHKESNQPKLVQPFKTLGWNIECVAISEYHRALFMAIVTILLQSMGITVVVYKLMMSYFHQNNVKCVLDTKRWNEVYSLKMLSFLWALVITFSIGAQLGALRRNGLYRMATELNHNEIGSIHYINFWWIRAGQILNYYACLISVIGSFFIIFETNAGEMEDGERDYAHSGLEMVLNAVALFFMLELDDCLVSYQDFRDIESIIHQHFITRDEQIVESQQKCHREGVNASSSVNNNIKYCGTLTECIAFFVKFWLYVFGVFAPFAVFLCY